MVTGTEPHRTVAPTRSGLAERLLDAALELYLERGVGDTTLSAVAGRAGVSRPTVYKHVGDVEALADAVIRREIDRFFIALGAVLTGGGPARARIVESVAFTVEHARSHPLLRRQLELEPALILPVFTVGAGAVLATAVDLVVPLARLAIEEGGLPDRDPAALAEVAARLAISLIFAPSPQLNVDDPDALRGFVGIALPGG